MKFEKYYIVILVLVLTVSVTAQSPNVNQFLNSQLTSTFSAEIEEIALETPLLRFERFSNSSIIKSIQQDFRLEQITKLYFMRELLLLAPVSDVQKVLTLGKQNGEMLINHVMQLPLALNNALGVIKQSAPHPTSFDTGNIVQISPGSWIRVNEQFSFILDLPLYYYSINYANGGPDRMRDRVSISEKSFNKGEFLPLIYQFKIGMGIDF